MRRVSEWIYFIAFIGNGLWAISSGIATVFSGFSDLELMGTWSSWLMLIIFLTLKLFGNIQEVYTKTFILLGITALFGGIWGFGTILIIMSGIMMLMTGTKQFKVIRSLIPYKEVRQIRRKQLEEIEKEELRESQLAKKDEESSVPKELLDGYRGKDDYTIEARTWIDPKRLSKEQLTERELKAIATQERRSNKISLETIVELEHVTSKEEVDLTYIELDLKSNEESNITRESPITKEANLRRESPITKETDLRREESDSITRKRGHKGKSNKKSILEMTLEDLIGD